MGRLTKTSSPRMSRLEVNLRQLLRRCEDLAREEPLEDNWRLRKYVESLGEMLADLKTTPTKAAKEEMAERLLDYMKRTAFLTGLLHTSALSDPVDKLEAVQQLSRGAATACTESASLEIHHKTAAKYGMELRSDLFGLADSDDSLRRRNIIKAPNFTSNGTQQEDMDTLLKYHQDMQEKVAENMVLLTQSLKEQSQIASTIIRKDTETLHKSSELTDRNMSSLQVESGKLQEHSRSAWKCWLWIMLAVVIIIFINMVLFMKVMKKKRL